MAQYVYEFLWRGRPDGEASYHVILAEQIESFGKTAHVESGVLTPEQAKTLGFPITAIVKNINAMALAARDQALTEKAAAEAERDAAIAERDRAMAELRAAEGVAAA